MDFIEKFKIVTEIILNKENFTLNNALFLGLSVLLVSIIYLILSFG